MPVGGGGLIAGTCVAAAHLAPPCEVVGVQAELYPSMVRRAGRPGVDPPRGDVDRRRHRREATRRHRPAHPDRRGVDVVTVPERRIEESVGLLAEVEKTVVEGAAATSLAALLADPARFAGRRVGIVLTGGNIDSRLLASVLLRSLVRQGRLTRLRVETDDLPGNLARIAATVGRLGGNLVEVTHHRLLSAVPVRRVHLDLLVETLDGAHLAASAPS